MATPIWNFQANEAVETDKVDLKTFKPVGKFFADVATLVKMFNIIVHPGMRESSYRQKHDKLSEEREINALNFYKYRLDRNSLRVCFLALPPQNIIQTLK